MQKFKYKALNSVNDIVEGEIEAYDLREARKKIRNLGFIPTKVYNEKPNIQEQTEEFSKSRIKHLTLSQKIMFTSELQTMLESGIPILEALNVTEINSPDLKIKTLCSELKMSILEGRTFAQSLEYLYGKVFGSVYIGIVKTGEESGELDVTLDRMLTLLKKQDFIKSKIISASIYPCILIAILFILLVGLAKFIFPRFMAVMDFNGIECPPLAQALMGFMNFVGCYWWLILIGIGALFGALTMLFKNPKIKSYWDNFILKVPVVSTFIEYINLSNFMTVLHVSYEAGIPLPSGMELANKTVGNFTIKDKILKSISLARTGATLTNAFGTTGAIPSAFLSLISAGEKSGTLGKMFKDVSDVIDKKVDMALQAMAKLFEPAVIIIIGGVIAFIAIAFYQAYVSMLGSLL